MEGYSVMYYPTADAGSSAGEAAKKMKNVDGITRTSDCTARIEHLRY